jgi:catechol 2,3-dioxygenase-like lactoylglutathione lyase family enzyme
VAERALRCSDTMAGLPVNIDVDDLEKAIGFYTDALGLRVGRRLGRGRGCAEPEPQPSFASTPSSRARASSSS